MALIRVHYCFIIACLCTHLCATAQVLPKSEQAAEKKELEPPHDLKIIEEHKDDKGNTIRTIRYKQGRYTREETLTIPSEENMYKRPINADTLNKDSVLLVVNKGKFNIEVYYKRKKIRSYKAVFGPKPLEDKRMSGDRCTPEGMFVVQSKNPKSKYDKFMLLNYPNDSSIARFNTMKAKGMLPKTATMGGDVGIHGIWKGGDDMIELGVCWTDGCVALKNKDIEELYTFVVNGTRVFIRK